MHIIWSVRQKCSAEYATTGYADGVLPCVGPEVEDGWFDIMQMQEGDIGGFTVGNGIRAGCLFWRVLITTTAAAGQMTNLDLQEPNKLGRLILAPNPKLIPPRVYEQTIGPSWQCNQTPL